MRWPIALLFACSGVDRDIDPYVHLEQGLYGQLTYDAMPNARAKVGMFEPDTDVQLGVAYPDARGIYQLAAPTSTVGLCIGDETPSSFAASIDCITTIVPVGTLRQDWTVDDAGPHWCDGPCVD